VEFVDDLPKTLTGKIRRIELRQRELERSEH
jgi:acetyl-CoA synthetase